MRARAFRVTSCRPRTSATRATTAAVPSSPLAATRRPARSRARPVWARAARPLGPAREPSQRSSMPCSSWTSAARPLGTPKRAGSSRHSVRRPPAHRRAEADPAHRDRAAHRAAVAASLRRERRRRRTRLPRRSRLRAVPAAHPQPFTRADAEAFVAVNMTDPWETLPTFAIVLDGHVIGTVNLEIDPASRTAMIGYAIARSHWGRGLAAEAARAAIAWAFAEHDLDEIWASTHVDHVQSRRVMEKLGMTFDPAMTGQRGAAGDVVYRLRR